VQQAQGTRTSREVSGDTGMTFDETELRLAGIDERNITAIHGYEEYLRTHLPPSEIIRDMYINVDFEVLLSDLYFFTSGLMIEIPDFITWYQDKFHSRKMDFTIHPVRKAIVLLNMKISEGKSGNPRSVEVNFTLKKGDTFSFFAMKENAARLEQVAATYLMPNLEND
jgi:hypothetical protein